MAASRGCPWSRNSWISSLFLKSLGVCSGGRKNLRSTPAVRASPSAALYVVTTLCYLQKYKINFLSDLNVSTKFHSVNRGRTCFYLTILRVREVEFAELLHGGDVGLVGAGVGRVQQPAGLVQVSRHEILR